MTDRRSVDTFFDNDAAYWRTVYGGEGLDAQIYRRRHGRVIRRIEELNLPHGTHALEIGCGAGNLSVALAHRGFDVVATDSSERMLQQAAEGFGREQARISLLRADAEALPVEQSLFGIVIAVGVVPWVPSPTKAIHEMFRVLRPGGYLVVTSDNLGRLNVVLDPRKVPALGPLRKAIGRRLRASGLAQAPPPVAVSMYRRRDVLRWLEDAGLTIRSSETIGFGPLTLFDRHVMSEERSIRLDERLQRLADRGIPFVAGAGAHQLVVARKAE